MAVIITVQFILGRKQLEYGFFIDDWDNLAAYKMFVTNPITDILTAWKALGSHRFAHVYYIGILFEFFKFDYLSYNITNQILKALSAFTLFPVVYLLFKNKLVAFLATLIYTIHYSPFGTLDDVSRGEDFLAIISMNLFLVLYIRASQKHTFNLKTMLALLILFISTAFFAPSRTYPVILMLPLLELLNFKLNKPSTTLKASILRIVFLYSPFVLALLFSPGVILAQIGYYKGLWEMLKIGNNQLFLAPFASFGSTFVPQYLFTLFGPPYYQKIEAFISSLLPTMLIIFIPFFMLVGFLTNLLSKRFIIQTILISTIFSLLAFVAVNRWIYLDLKVRASVDPAVFFIPSLIGLFIISITISLYKEWLNTNKKNAFILGLSLSPIISFLYIFMTWVLTDVNSIFLGVHPYLNIPSLGTSIFLAIFLYLIYKRLNLRVSKIILITCLIIFYLISAKNIEQYFSYWLKNGFAAADQRRMLDTFWKEIGRDKQYSIDNPALIYLDGFLDPANGMYYENAFVWRLPAFLLIETGKTLAGCDLFMYKVDIKEIKVKTFNDKKVITQDRCGSNLIYPLENFYAFKLINRDIIPNRLEVLKKIGIK